MKTNIIKKVGAISLITLSIILTGCGEIEKTEVTETPTTETETDGNGIVAEGKVIEDTTLVCENPIEKTFFAEEADWLDVVNSTEVKVIKEQKDTYDSEFFESRALCYIPQVASGGMEYRFEGATLEEEAGKTVLTVYATYSSDKLLNTQCSYGFFIELDKKEVSRVDEIRLEVCERE